MANALVTPILSPLWLFPLIAISWFHQKPLYILIAVILFITLYGLLYVLIPEVQKK